MRRAVQPEWLDELPRDDPRARRSRGDLRTINALMGNARIIANALAGTEPSSIVELGGGDGTLLLQVARRLARPAPAHAVIVDRQSLLTDRTRTEFADLSWEIESIPADVFDWLKHAPGRTCVIVANLFLHHFADGKLSELLHGVSQRTETFVACEPRRARSALVAASLTRLIGCNAVTVHDARISVRAGFRDRELSALWPQGREWRLVEGRAGCFTHGFVARRMR